MLSSSWKDILTGFSNTLTVLEASIHHKTFLWETLVWLSIMKLHSIIRVTERLIHNFCFSAQEGSGGLWDSVKKAAFVIGSGILFLAAFGNSLTW